MFEEDFQGVYVHIPFCLKKCFYCDFPSYAGLTEEFFDLYLDALSAEIRADASTFCHTPTIFFGGGTPTLLSVKQLSRIVSALEKKGLWSAAVERTIEANPGTVDFVKLRDLKSLGFDRLSIGVQSFSNDLLCKAGRIHTGEQARETVGAAERAGWENISVDLIYGLPGQTLAILRDSLETALSLEVRHLSVYGLHVEERTPLAEMLVRGEIELPPEDADADMYDMLTEYLPQKTFRRYEISNYAKAGYECKHNNIYWKYYPYRGFGLAATSFDGRRRLTNTFDLDTYIKGSAGTQTEMIDKQTRMAEFVFMGLRRAEGIDPEDFQAIFAADIYAVYGGQIEENMKKGLLIGNGNIRLTKEGMKFGNQVFLTFLPFFV